MNTKISFTNNLNSYILFYYIFYRKNKINNNNTNILLTIAVIKETLFFVFHGEESFIKSKTTFIQNIPIIKIYFCDLHTCPCKKKW
jgi:hypothetical protein